MYKNGTDKAYYTCEEEGVYFVSDGDGSYIQISEANLFNEPYFEFDYYSTDGELGISKYNGRGVKSYDEIKLSWTDPDHDFVLSNGYDQSVTLEKTFKDQNDTIYQSNTYDSDALATKKLTPIFAHEHPLAHVPAAAPTCDKEGCIEHWYCEQCEKYFSDQDAYFEIPQSTAIIPPNGHTFDHTAALVPTYNAETGVYTPGNIEYWHCTVCDKCFSDANGNTEVAFADTVLPYFKLTKLDNGTAHISKYNAHDADIVIPETVPESLATDDLPAGTAITQVGAYSFKQNTYIRNVTMGDNIDTIDYQSFQNCSNLETVTVGSSLNDLRYESFKDCPNLRSFTCTSKNKFFYNENLGEPFGGSRQAVAYVYHNSSLMKKLSIKIVGIDRHSEPTWTWAEDFSSATADINCNISSCKYHSGELPATVTSEVTAQPTDEADGIRTYTATVVVDGETAVHHYSVRSYCDVILSDAYMQSYSDDRFSYNELATLVKTMLNYGATAQKQFDHNTDNLANAGVTGYDLAELTDAEIESLGNALPNSADTADALSAYGVKYYGCSLLLRSKTTLRFYFEKTDESKYDAANFKIDDAAVTVNNYGDGSRYVYIEVTNIAAPDLAATHKVTVGDVEIGNVSPLNYAKDVLSDADASADLKNVITALYRYHEAAEILFC